MSNRIGNYIHYHKSNYIKYGIGVKSPNKQNFSYQQYRNRLLKLYQNGKIHTFAKKYETTLNELYNDIDKANIESKISKEKQEQLVDAINTVLLNELNHISSKVQLDQNGNFIPVVQAGGSSISGFNYTKSLINKHFKNRKDGIRRDTLIKYKEDIDNKIKLLLTFKNVNELQTQLDLLKHTAIKIEKYLEKNIIGNTFHMSKSNDLEAILINVMKCYQYDFNLSYYLNNGIIGEVMGAFAAEFAAQKANVEVSKIQKKIKKGLTLTGTVQSSPNLQISNSTQMNTVFSSVFAPGFSKWTMSQGESQNKADITVDFGGSLVGINYKKYGSNTLKNKGIRTTSPTSLLTYLVDEDSNFINHWLNLITVADNPHADRGISHIQSKKQEAQSIMKLIIALKSIRGAQGRQGNADIFAVNIGKNKFKVYTLYDIIEKISLTSQLAGVEVEGLPNEYKQYWSGHDLVYSMKEAPNRINKLLTDIHEKKIGVHLTKNTGLF